MDKTVELDLREFLRVLLKRIWIVILCAVVFGASVYAYTVNFVTPQYEASVSIYVNNSNGKDNYYLSSGDLAVALRLVATYVNIIESDTVLDKVIQETGLLLSTGQLRNMISAEVVGETEMFRVTVKTPNAQMSADLANAIAAIAPEEIAKIIEASSAKVIDYAKVPMAPSSPNYKTSTVLGAFVGALLAVAVILLQTMLDVRIKNEEDILKISPIPVLGVIPDLNAAPPKRVRKVKR